MPAPASRSELPGRRVFAKGLLPIRSDRRYLNGGVRLRRCITLMLYSHLTRSSTTRPARFWHQSDPSTPLLLCSSSSNPAGRVGRNSGTTFLPICMGCQFLHSQPQRLVRKHQRQYHVLFHLLLPFHQHPAPRMHPDQTNDLIPPTTHLLMGMHRLRDALAQQTPCQILIHTCPRHCYCRG